MHVFLDATFRLNKLIRITDFFIIYNSKTEYFEVLNG